METLIPVIKQRRCEWEIPHIDAPARLLEQKQEEERIRILCDGTTPQGREILRKIIFRAERMMQDETCSDPQILTTLGKELKLYEILQEEFLLLLSRMWQVDLAKMRKLPLNGIAGLLLLRLKLERTIRIAKSRK